MVNGMTKEVKLNVKDRVRKVLDMYRISRNNDKMLFILFLNKYYGLKKRIGEKAYITLKEILKEGPAIDSIRRARQSIQDGGKGEFLSDEHIYKNRMKEEEKMRLAAVQKFK